MVDKLEIKSEVPQSEVSQIDSYGDDYQNRPRSKKDRYSVSTILLNLPTPQRKGFVRQWVIDKEQRIFLARDWKFVKGEDGQPMRQVMNHRTKDPEYGSYMEIPEIYFQENLDGDDQIRKDLIERRIKNKDIEHETAEGSESGAGKVDANKFYTPSAFENKIERNNKK